MDAIKLASTYFFGTEDYLSANSMIATITFKRKISPATMYSSYRLLILNNPLLQAKKVELPAEDSFVWEPFTEDELDRLLALEQTKQATYRTEAEILADYAPTNDRLPFRIDPINEFTMIFAMNHAVANGLSLVFWIQRWLEYYSGAREAKSGIASRELVVPVNRKAHLGKKVAAYTWMPVFIAGFLFKAMGRGGGASGTVDLSGGRKPETGGTHAKRSYCFSQEETAAILRHSRNRDMTLTEYVCYRMTEGLLQHAPKQQRVFVSMPMDLQHLLHYSPETMHGNYVASLPMQFFRSGDVAKQVKREFRWFKRGVPYALSIFFASFSNSYRKYKEQCLQLSMKSMPERFPAWNFSITLSNLGRITHPLLEEWIDTIYFSIKNQSVLLTTATLSGRLMMEVSVLEKLYDSEEVFGLFDRILSPDHLLSQAESVS